MKKKQKQVLLVKAFTQDPARGNPAGVILDAEGLDEKQMIAIAAKLDFSESAFVFPSKVADFKVRFFTPIKEVSLCGHATIATFFTLVSEGLILFDNQDSITKTQETDSGVLKVSCHKNGFIEMEQSSPIFYDDEFNRQEISELLHIKESDLSDWPIELVSTGTPKLLIPVKSLRVVETISPNLEAMKLFCKNSHVRGFYPFTRESIDASDFQARQFNPFAGIDEDPITGVAAGALGAYVVKHGYLPQNKFIVEQGFTMNKGGKMYVTISGDKVIVGGYAALFGRKNL